MIPGGGRLAPLLAGIQVRQADSPTARVQAMLEDRWPLNVSGAAPASANAAPIAYIYALRVPHSGKPIAIAAQA